MFLSSLMLQATYPLPIPVSCSFSLSDILRSKTYLVQLNILCGSLLASSSTILSANAHSPGGSVTTVRTPPFHLHRGSLRPHIIVHLLNFHLFTTDLLQAAMDTGTALATVIIFFALSYNGITLDWWGNSVGSNTDDTNAVPYLTVPDGSYFGKGPGQF